jgi:RNA polymerase sigma factor (sigma-70 family)
VARPARGESVQVPATFELFYAANKDQVLQALLAVTGSHPVAEDATQEAFVRAYANWKRLERHPNPRAWVIKVALNAQRSWWRKRRREISDPQTLNGAVAAAPRQWADPTVTQVLQTLPLMQRTVVALRVLYDFTPREVADVLAIAEGTVWAHQHKGMRKLRTTLTNQSVVEKEQP